jgi:hypothetical protein
MYTSGISRTSGVRHSSAGIAPCGRAMSWRNRQNLPNIAQFQPGAIFLIGKE